MSLHTYTIYAEGMFVLRRGGGAGEDKIKTDKHQPLLHSLFYHHIRHQQLSIIDGLMRGRTIVYLEFSVVFLCI